MISYSDLLGLSVLSNKLKKLNTALNNYILTENPNIKTFVIM